MTLHTYLSELNHLLRTRQKQLEDYIRLKKDSLKSAPPGSLRISPGKKRTQYYLYSGPTGDQKYLKSMDLVRSLAQKDYDQKVLKASEAELRLISGFLKHYTLSLPEDIYSLQSQERRSLTKPDVLTDAEYVRKWLELPYSGKKFKDNFTEYITDHGERVRSKSELLIANYLFHKGIPYRYEYPVYLKGVGTFYPDFTVLNIRLRKEYIHEHFGMMDDPEYADHTVSKIGIYMANGIFPGEKLIITAETRVHPLSMKQLDYITEKYYL